MAGNDLRDQVRETSGDCGSPMGPRKVGGIGDSRSRGRETDKRSRNSLAVKIAEPILIEAWTLSQGRPKEQDSAADGSAFARPQSRLPSDSPGSRANSRFRGSLPVPAVSPV